MAASEQRKNTFMKEIRGEIGAANGSPSDTEDEDSGFGIRSKQDSNAYSAFILNPSRMRDYQTESAATGLENLFNSAFTIKERPIEELRKEQEERQKREQEKGFVMSGETVRENVIIMRATTALVTLLVLGIAVVVASGWVDVKMLIERLLYESEVVRDVHEVVEEAAQSYHAVG